VGWSIPLAFAWGVVIINIDRLLIITMAGTRGHPVQMVVTILARLALAALIALVVATPLVLQIFHGDISAELPIQAEKKSQQFKQSLANDTDENQLAKIGPEIAADNAVINGTGPSQVSTDQAAVNALTIKVDAARETDTTAYQKWQCEIGGLKAGQCPPGTSGRVGNGPYAHGDEVAYDNDVQTYDSLNDQLTASETDLNNNKKLDEQGVTAAQHNLAQLKVQQVDLQNKIAAKTVADDAANKQDTGLLAQLTALSAASEANPGLAAARWTVTALFFIIEILPVTVKCLLLLAPESAYEQIVTKKGDAAIAQAELTLQGETDAVEVRAQQIRDMAAIEAEHQRNTRTAQLQSEYAILQDRSQAQQDIEADMTRRDKGTRIEVNRRFASATREHILAAVDEWVQGVRDKINKSMQPEAPEPGQQQQSGQAAQSQGANGQGPLPHTTVQYNPGYTMPNGSGL
jgi:hypothetical protein